MTSPETSSHNSLTFPKRLFPNSVVQIVFLKSHPDIYLFGNTNMLISSERYKPYPLFNLNNQIYKLYNTYPYKSDLCYYQFVTNNSLNNFIDDCYGVKCLNLCDDFIIKNSIRSNTPIKYKISVVGQQINIEGNILCKIIFILCKFNR